MQKSSKRRIIGKCANPRCIFHVYAQKHKIPIVHDNIYFGRHYFCSKECKDVWVYDQLEHEIESSLTVPMRLQPFKKRGDLKII